MDKLVFAVAGAVVILGALGVVFSRNPVHSALSLVATLFGVAVLFVEQGAHFLAAVQVIVYAGAIVVLFLFVIMLLGVDRDEDISREPLPGQRVLALVAGALVIFEILVLAGAQWVSGAQSVTGPLTGSASNVETLARAIFTRYLLPFEATSVLLVIAVIGAVVLARRSEPLSESESDHSEAAS
jgi:NADH-quinone oxidoreductase subunit J